MEKQLTFYFMKEDPSTYYSEKMKSLYDTFLLIEQNQIFKQFNKVFNNMIPFPAKYAEYVEKNWNRLLA